MIASKHTKNRLPPLPPIGLDLPPAMRRDDGHRVLAHGSPLIPAYPVTKYRAHFVPCQPTS